MDKQQQGFQAPMVGGSSLLVIFAVLCLTVFALLAISTVQADKRLADASINAVSEYYEADCKAEKILAGLRRGEIPEDVHYENGVYRFTVHTSDTQRLLAEVSADGNGGWDVLCWRTVSTTQSNAEELITVWSGDL